MNNQKTLMRQVMAAIQQTDEWERIWMEDPMILKAKRRLNEALQLARPSLPAQVFDELWTAITEIEAADECVSILYGARVATALQDMLYQPMNFSQYMLDWNAQTDTGAEGSLA